MNSGIIPRRRRCINAGTCASPRLTILTGPTTASRSVSVTPRRIGFGAAIEGWGETVGERLDANTRTSALKFGSDDRRSLIRAGSGYWKYEQIADEVRFITGYDYEVRWGPVGWAFDRLLFRPLIGWATAWSFDRLRLWIE